MSTRKRKAITIETKYEIIQAVDKGDRQKKEIAQAFDILPNTLSTIIKNRDDIIINYETYAVSPSRKRQGSGQHDAVESAVFKWFTEKRSANIPISGPLIMTKSDELAEKIGDKTFKSNTGWLERFKQRHGISCGSICGESAEVNEDTTNDWLENKLPNLLKNYEPKDIYNADETGLFFKLLPNKTLKMKGEKCFGGKKSKERISVLLCSNMDGTDMFKPLVIGKFQNPRCFKGVKSLPVDYKWNRKAWMTSDIFVEWIRKFDAKMALQNRKVLLFVDNCSAHPRLDNLKAVKLAFLPPNCTSKLQPMDQGVIYNFKVKYRQSLIEYILQCHDSSREPEVHVLRAIRMLYNAWRQVSVSSVKKCFRKAGFSDKITVKDYDGFDLGDDIPLANIFVDDDESDDDDDVPFAQLIAKLHNKNGTEGEMPCVRDFVTVDDDVIATSEMTDDDIVASVSDTDFSDEDDDLYDPDPLPSVNEIDSQLRDIERFIEAQDSVSDKIFHSLATIKAFVQNVKGKNQQQKKITDFFSV